jgi:hypothetical protein
MLRSAAHQAPSEGSGATISNSSTGAGTAAGRP